MELRPLSKSAWIRISQICLLLQLFHPLTQIVSGENYPTLPAVMIGYNWLMNNLEMVKNGKPLPAGKLDHDEVKKAAAAAFDKITEYYDKTNEIHYVVCILDPHLKLNLFMCETERKDVTPAEEVKQM